MSKDQLRLIIRKYLAEKPRNTAEISAWVNSQNSPSNSAEITAVMESDETLVRIGTVHKSGDGWEFAAIVGMGYRQVGKAPRARQSQRKERVK